jgi:hypothetical protein
MNQAILVFDETVSSTAVYTEPRFNKLLAAFDKYALHAIASPTTAAGNFTVQLEQSSDERTWANKNGAAEVNAVALSTTAPTSAMGADAGTVVGQGNGRLRVQLSAGIARVKIWAIGRKA